MGDFLNSIQGKIIAALTIMALVFGIVAEGVTIYRNAKEGETAAETAHNAAALKLAEAQKAAEDAKTAAANAETARETANNAAKLKLAEAEEKAQLAKKAAADAEKAKEDAKTARAVAENAERLKIAEAEEKVQLAAFDAETARETAKNAAALKLAEAQKTAEDAENLRLKNKVIRGFTDGSGDGDKMVMNSFNRGLDMLWGNSPAPRQQESEAQPAPSQAPATPYVRVKSEESGGKLNLRNGAGRRHDVLAELPAGTVLRQVGACIQSDDGVTRDPWCKVDWNGTAGWASSSGLERVQQ